MSFGRLERAQASRPMSDINMTPLIDVMLVLLVIFIVAAPLLASSLKLDLPKTDAARPGDGAASIAVAVDAAGRLYLADQPLDDAAFAQQLAEAARRNPQADVLLRADRAVPYGRVAELIGTLQKAGLTRIGFVAEPPR
jgi:biopolymer transport protein TolR